MRAPERFAAWLNENRYHDKKLPCTYLYHPRSDIHSRVLCRFILDDLLINCHAIASAAINRDIVFGINVRYTFPNNKKKTLDLALGASSQEVLTVKDDSPAIIEGPIDVVSISCEAKSVMTEHGKSQPRVFDELSSSHEIVHQADPKAIAAGITIVNISKTFVSPLRQRFAQELEITKHNQPHVTESMVQHLRGLSIRSSVNEVGFDAYATVIVDCDNQTYARLWIDTPAPQEGDHDHYSTFISRICSAFKERYR